MAVAKVTATTMSTMTAAASKASIAAGLAAGVGVTAAMSATGTAGATAGMTTTGTAMATTTLMNSVAAHAQGSGGEQCHKQQIAHDAIILESGSKSSRPGVLRTRLGTIATIIIGATGGKIDRCRTFGETGITGREALPVRRIITPASVEA